ncbi:TPA: hypothetical protein ACH3X2_011068 [Trebouxia sp. C0005]
MPAAGTSSGRGRSLSRSKAGPHAAAPRGSGAPGRPNVNANGTPALAGMTAINSLALRGAAAYQTHSDIAANPAPQLHPAAPTIGVPAMSQQAQATAAPTEPRQCQVVECHPNDGSGIVPKAQQPQMPFMAWQSPQRFPMQAPMGQHPSMAMAASQTQLFSGSGEHGAARQQPSQPPMPMFQHWPNAFPVPQQYGSWAGLPGPHQYFALPPMQGSGSVEDTTYHPPPSQPQQSQTSLATSATGATLPPTRLPLPRPSTALRRIVQPQKSTRSLHQFSAMTAASRYTGFFQAVCSHDCSRLGMFGDTSLFINDPRRLPGHGTASTKRSLPVSSQRRQSATRFLVWTSVGIQQRAHDREQHREQLESRRLDLPDAWVDLGPALEREMQTTLGHPLQDTECVRLFQLKTQHCFKDLTAAEMERFGEQQCCWGRTATSPEAFLQY